MRAGWPHIGDRWARRPAVTTASAAASVVGMAFFAHAFKFLWAPLADYSLTRKTWYRLAITVMCVVLVALTATPMNAANVPWLAALVLCGNLAATFVAFATEGPMAHNAGRRGSARRISAAGALTAYASHGHTHAYAYDVEHRRCTARSSHTTERPSREDRRGQGRARSARRSRKRQATGGARRLRTGPSAHPQAPRAGTADVGVILVDTSIWVDHLRATDRQLARLLLDDAVLGHPFVVGELACGALRHRSEILGLLRHLPQAPVVEHDEVLAFIEAHALAGSGLGWIDVHLLASATLAGERVWTRDRRLALAARRLGVAA